MKLNISKIKDGENNQGYYSKMNDWYLHDLDEILGSYSNIWIDGNDIVIGSAHDGMSIRLLFDKYSGEYSGCNFCGFTTGERRHRLKELSVDQVPILINFIFKILISISDHGYLEVKNNERT